MEETFHKSVTDEEAQNVELNKPNCCGKIYLFLCVYKDSILVVIWPLVTLPIIICSKDDVKFRWFYSMTVLYGYWITECISPFVTGLIPILIMPLLNIEDSTTVCVNYFYNTIMLTSAMLNSIAVAHSNLHERIALYMILKIGCSQKRLHFGLIMVTMFLSIWMSNALAAEMMFPVMERILMEMEEFKLVSTRKKHKPIFWRWKNQLAQEAYEREGKYGSSNITIAYFMGITYAASCGGMSYIVGTGSNLSFKGLYIIRFAGATIETEAWFLFSVPGMLLIMIFIWFWLQVVFLGMFMPTELKSKYLAGDTYHNEIARGVIENIYKSLGPLSWHEISVGLVYIVCILLWFLRKPKYFRGWAYYLSDVEIDDSASTVFITVLLVAIPAKITFLNACSEDPMKRPTVSSEGLVTWTLLKKKMMWGKIFMFGGAQSLAYAGIATGATEHLGKIIAGVFDNKDPMPVVVFIALTSFITCLLTELASNVVTCNMIIPIIIEMALVMKIHPAILSIPSAFTCSFSFILPCSTSSMRFVSEHASIHVKDLILAGLIPKMIAWMVILMLFPTYGRLFFNEKITPPSLESIFKDTAPENIRTLNW